jgi:diamine N-acetyltransferase
MNQNFELENIRIEVASLRDGKILLRLIKAYYRYEGLRFDCKMIERGLSEFLGRPEFGEAWLISDGRRAIGYLIFTFLFDLEFGGRQVGITDLFIYSRFRRKGVGRHVLCQLDRFCKAKRIRSIELQVLKKNRKVTGFYRRVGFREHDRIPMSKQLDP